jgi:methionyl-tRNA formyltransferase
MKIVYFSGSDFTLPILEQLIRSGHTVKLVTNPDTLLRGKLLINKLKQYAISESILVWQPISVRKVLHETMIEQCSGYDTAIVASYGKILPKTLLNLFPLGAINWHPSLLPLYRGPTPVQTALLDGATNIGLTWIEMDDKMDEGNIILQKEIPISTGDNFGLVIDKAVKLGVETLHTVLDLVEKHAKGTYVYIPQDHTAATYTTMLTKDMGTIYPSALPAVSIERMVRAYSAFPKTVFAHPVYASIRIDKASVPYGVVTIDDTDGILAHGNVDNRPACLLLTQDGYLQLDKITLAGGKQVDLSRTTVF